MSPMIGRSVCSTVISRLFLNIVSEEVLIDFRELIGQHSGANMAAAVFETMERLGLKGRVSENLFHDLNFDRLLGSSNCFR